MHIISPNGKNQGWGAEAGRSGVFFASWSRSRSREKIRSWSRSPLEKKSGARAAKI